MKKIALINDLSGFGKCSLTAAIPVVSALGVQACPLPTAILSAQTGFSSYFYDDYTPHMQEITREWRRLKVSFDGIYSGYLCNVQQIDQMLHFLEYFHDESTLYLADPIMGDHGKCFPVFDDDFRQRMLTLTQKADVITPNLTELCLLAEADYDKVIAHNSQSELQIVITELAHHVLAKASTKQTVLVTGILCQEKGQTYIGNLSVSENDVFYLQTPYTGVSFSGTGDLFASTIIGCLVQGLSISAAMKKAADFLQPSIEAATKEGIPRNHGVCFEPYLANLLPKQ